jgi:hypothetical protein
MLTTAKEPYRKKRGGEEDPKLPLPRNGEIKEPEKSQFGSGRGAFALLY